MRIYILYLNLSYSFYLQTGDGVTTYLLQLHLARILSKHIYTFHKDNIKKSEGHIDNAFTPLKEKQKKKYKKNRILIFNMN